MDWNLKPRVTPGLAMNVVTPVNAQELPARCAPAPKPVL